MLTEDAQRFADQMGIQLYETSAKDNINVEQVTEFYSNLYIYIFYNLYIFIKYNRIRFLKINLILINNHLF